jgi:NTE family protein
VKRMVVIGGGGVTGIAWATGVVAGLARAGVDLSQAGGFFGTSAGSVVGAQLAHGVGAEELLAAQLQPSADSKEQSRPYSQSAADEQNRKLVEKLGGDLDAARRRIGAFALRSETVSVDVRRAIIADRLPDVIWPDRFIGVVAVDAEAGTHRLFHRGSGVDFVDAIAASCAVPGAWPVVEIDGHRFMDGGIRSMTNADLAEGACRVVVIAPLGYSDGNPVSGHLRREVAGLESGGTQVTVIVPDATAQDAIGDNVLDPARRASSARAGLEQGLAAARTLAASWNAT